MVDISRHLARAKQGIERRNYDLAIEILTECQEVDPTNLEMYKMLLDAAKRRMKETGKKGGFSLGFSSKDPHKALTGAVKKVARVPDGKNCQAVGDAAKAVYEAGVKGMVHVAILFYEETRGSGLFVKEVLLNLAHMYHAQAKEQKAANKEEAAETLRTAIQVMHELSQGDANFGESAKTVKAWEATLSIWGRGKAGASGGKFAVADDKEARRTEVMGRVIRTADDAMEVLSFFDEDLAENPDDKRLWLKKGDVHRRVRQYAEAISAFEKAQGIDQHDFVITMRLGDTRIEQFEHEIGKAKEAGQDTKPLAAQLLETQIQEYSTRVERQPTEMSHRFNLGKLLFKQGKIDESAAHFQKAKEDARFRGKCLYYLGHCFAKKKLLDIAKDQFTECLSLIGDSSSDEYKRVLYDRARVLEAAGDIDGAIADLRKIVEIDLGYKDAAERLAKLRENRK